MIGTTISHYRILEKLGEGGMGIVYKAEDTKLKRTVALKFLPQQVSATEEEKARFIQEAQAASALNHPNVCTIHDIQEHGKPAYAGAPAGKQMFIVMEFVDGRTLQERRGSLTLKQAIDIGIQIADGLAAAHEKGIVHRDIKPDNIMLRKDGIAQIMDFGLAKLRATGATRLTKEGSTVGTVGYMSPEQVQGLDTDHRSDIFSFGVLLYELLSGQLPFRGVHETALMYEIVNVDPPLMSSVRTEIDPALDAIILECLAKDPSERFQSIVEVSKELRRFKRESGRSRITRAMPVSAPQSSTVQSTHAVEGSGLTRERLFWAVGIVVLIGLLAYFMLGRNQAQQQSTFPIRFIITPPNQTTIEESAVSPDGKTIALTVTKEGATLLWIRPMNALHPQELAGTEDAAFPFWSPDSRFIGFFAEGKLKKVDPSGGPPVAVCDARDGRGGSWNRDGDILFAAENSGIFRVSAAGGIPRPVTSLDSSRNESSHAWPSFLPDGKHFLYLALRVFDEAATTYISSLDDTARIRVLSSDANIISAPPSGVLFLRNRTLMYQGFDIGSGQLEGDPKPVAVDVGYVARLALGDFSYSASGVLTSGGGRSVNRQYGWFDRKGLQVGTAGPPGNYFDISPAPSVSQAAVQRVDPQTGNSDIWIIDIKRNLISRFTFEPGVEDDPVWSVDGKYVYYSNAKGGAYNVYRKLAAGLGSPEMVTTPGIPQRPMHMSRDGRYLLCEAVHPKTQEDIWIVPTDPNEKPFSFLATPFIETLGQFSPDGKWIAYTSDESGKDEIYVQSFPGSGGRWQVSTGGGSQARWRQDGRELFYIAPDLKLMSVAVRPGSTFDFEAPKPLFQTRVDSYAAPNRYAVVENGQKFLINIPIGDERANPITVSINPLE